METRNKLFAAAAAVLLTASSAYGQSAAANDAATKSLYEAAQKEGQLTWYSSQTPASSSAAIVKFEELFPGVKVNLLRLAGSELGIRYEQELNAGVVSADMISIADPAFILKGTEAGWFADLSKDTVPELASWPEKYLEAQSVNIGISPVILAWNTDNWTGEEPTSWNALLNSNFKQGDVTLPDPRNVPLWLGTYYLWLNVYGEDFLKSLGTQGFTLVNSVVPGTQQLAAGATTIMPSNPSVVAALKNAPIKTVEPQPTTGSSFLTAISKNGKSPNATKLFLNYLLSAEGQEQFNLGGGLSPRGEFGDVKEVPANFDPDLPLKALNDKARIVSLLGLE